MWARNPRNLTPAPFVRNVMRERSECPINPEIGNSYLLSDARPKSCKKRRRRVIDQYMHSQTYITKIAAVLFTSIIGMVNQRKGVQQNTAYSAVDHMYPCGKNANQPLSWT